MARSFAPRATPPWLAITAFAAVMAVLFTWPSWPGYMSFDSLFAYDQALHGVQTSLWPPMHTYFFVLSRWAHAGAWGVFLLQTFVLFFGAALAIHELVPRRALAWGLSAAFALGLVYFPTLLGTLMVQWRDGPTGGFTLLGLGLWLTAARRRSMPILIGAVLAFGLAAALRYNALALVGPILALMIRRPFLAPGERAWARAVAGAAIVIVLGLAWASTQWRLPDLKRLPDPQSFGGTQLFDVIGVSACAGHSYLPPISTKRRPLSGAQLRALYDARHLLNNLQPHPGIPQILESDAHGLIGRIWKQLLVKEPGCYLAHRTAVFAEQMGMLKDHVFYPVHGAIDPNPYGLAVAHPRASAWWSAYVERNAPEMWRRPFWLYALAAVLGLGAATASRDRGWLVSALLVGAFAYPALLFVASPAADARYIFPSSVLCLVIVAASVGLLLGPRETRR